MAESLGKIHDVFKDAVKDLADQAGDAADGVGNGERSWQIPASMTDFGPLDIDRIDEAFNRDEIGANYEDVIGDPTNPGTMGDAIALTMQSDYVAMMERAFRARHATPVRLLVLASARRKGHAHEAGVFHRNVMGHAVDALAAGAAGANIATDDIDEEAAA